MGQVLDAFATLPPYPDVKPSLERLQARGLVLASLGNGSKEVADKLFENAGLSSQGAKRAGLRGAWVGRLEKRFEPAMGAPDLAAESIAELVEKFVTRAMAGPSIFKWYKDDLAREDHMIGGMLMLMAATLPPNAGRESPPPRTWKPSGAEVRSWSRSRSTRRPPRPSWRRSSASPSRCSRTRAVRPSAPLASRTLENGISWPAVFIADKQGKIRWRSLAQTYKVRAMSGQILDALPK